VSWAWWDWPLTWLTNHRTSVLWHCWLGHVTRKTVFEMTYEVSSGTLNSATLYLVIVVNNKAKRWYRVIYIRTLLFLILCFSQGSVATRCRCGGKYGMNLVANLLLSPTVKKFWKSVDICQSYKQISSGMFLWPTAYINYMSTVVFITYSLTH